MPSSSPLPRSTPESQGISSTAILDFVSAVDEKIHHLHSIMLLRHGQVVTEGWWHPWRAESPHMLFSLSKSFTSTAVGLAVAEGRLSVDDEVLRFFPGEAPKKVSPNLAAMKVRHLLTMTSGHDIDTTERMITNRNPVKKFLSLPVEHMPGTHFVYNSGASFMLAAILQKLTGQTLLDYLAPRLFEPLGITGATWESHPSGVNFGGWGLCIKTEDIARFGQLYLQRGIWNNQRILPEAWVDAATMKQVPNGENPSPDWTEGYGYQFWRCQHHSYRADGAFGQFCVIMPEQDAVLAITAGITDMQPVLNLVWDVLLPAFRNEPLPINSQAGQMLSNTLSHLAIPLAQGETHSPEGEPLAGKTYCFEPNYETLHDVHFDFTQNTCILSYRLLGGGVRRGIHQLSIGVGRWIDGISYLGGLTPQVVSASGAWTASDTFTILICQYETPFILTLSCMFKGNEMIYNCKANASFLPEIKPELVGKAA